MTLALDQLSLLLRDSLPIASRPMPSADEEMESALVTLRKRNYGLGDDVSADFLQEAVDHFWNEPQIRTLKQGRLVSYGLCIPSRASGPCIMEDKLRFRAVLDDHDGIGKWTDRPRWYRRCYQGLLHCYFKYDGKAKESPAVGRQNWSDLRDYLREHVSSIVAPVSNPDWVGTATTNSAIFSDEPCRPYAQDVIAGKTDRIDTLQEHLAIDQSSWFLRELILAQIRYAIGLDDENFNTHIPALLTSLSGNHVVRDSGLVLLLDRYALNVNPVLHPELRDTSVLWWKNPWLPSNEARWGAVSEAAREMVGEWLKREFIEAFFAKLAQDGIGDRRRANFWLRYVKSMGEVRFALGSQALDSRDPDFRALLKKMEGLYTSLQRTGARNNAFIMTMGNLIAVEFGEGGNAFYGYDARKNSPFDVSKPLCLEVDARNSLKNSIRRIKLRHQDDILGFARWEDMFSHNLKKHFGIVPTGLSDSGRQAAARAVPPVPAQPASPTPTVNPFQPGTPFSKAAVTALARSRYMTVDDKTPQNGCLWVRTDDRDPGVNRVLRTWGFEYSPDRGWWKK